MNLIDDLEEDEYRDVQRHQPSLMTLSQRARRLRETQKATDVLQNDVVGATVYQFEQAVDELERVVDLSNFPRMDALCREPDYARLLDAHRRASNLLWTIVHWKGEADDDDVEALNDN
jgi:Mn-dependent DtxR family transcriptional regulator